MVPWIENDLLIPFLLDVFKRQGKLNFLKLAFKIKLSFKVPDYIYKVEFIVFIIKYEKINL